MTLKKTNLERFNSIDTDVALARFIRTGVNGSNIPGFKVQHLRNNWLRGANRRSLYHEFSIKKRSGGIRQIHAPYYSLKILQRIIADVLNEAYIPNASTAAHGYIANRSIKTNAIIHQKKRCVLRIDLEDFFPSIHLGRVRGILMGSPFNLPKDVADLIARICTFPIGKNNTILPQGAPTSPIISNLICRKLDREMLSMAKFYRCHYSRYADDLTFSTDRSSFPSEIQIEVKGKPLLGYEVLNIIRGNDFNVNASKTYLKNKHDQKIVTGLVVNEKINIRRKKVRELRALLHCWKVNGITVAREIFVEKFDKKNRNYEVDNATFRNIVKGRVQYVGHIKGWNDRVYLKLAKALAEVDNEFIFDQSKLKISNQKFHLLTEGKTDKILIEAALNNFKNSGHYQNLNIDFEEYSDHDMKGDSRLLQFCRDAPKNTREGIKICLFDKDNPKILTDVRGSDTLYRNWTNNVYSVVLPHPTFRAADVPICIEHYLTDDVLSIRDSNNRRLFRREEFDPRTGFHRTEEVVCSNIQKSTQIIDNDVYDFQTRQNIALPKYNFAKNIFNQAPPFDNIDFSAFEELFEEFGKILDIFESQNS